MKTLQAFAMSLLVLVAGLPISALAQPTPEVIVMPDAIAGGTYQVNIQAVLRDKYQLKVETDANRSVFRWSFAGGEMPPGLVLRPSGTIVGTPRVPREASYRFQVKVMDLAFAGSEGLNLDLSLTVAAHRIRLTQVRTPRLTPINPVATETHHQTGVMENRNGENVGAETRRDIAVQSAFLKPNTAPAPSFVEARDEVRPALSVSQPVNSANSNIADTSYDPQMVRSTLHAMKVKPPVPLPRLPSGEKEYEVDVAKEVSSADKIRGPAEITLKNVNVLRYDIRVGKDVRFPPAEKYTLPFIPPIPNQPEEDTEERTNFRLFDSSGARVSSKDPIDDKFRTLLIDLKAIEIDKTAQVNGVITAAITATNTAKNHLEALVGASDSILTTPDGPKAIITQIKTLVDSAGGGGHVDVALSHSWPDGTIETLLGRLELLKNGLLTLPTTGNGGWDNWYQGGNKAAYDYAVARVGELQNQLNGLKSNSTQGMAFQNAQNSLRRWKPILIGVRDGDVKGFIREFEVGCGFAFDTGKETKVKLIKRDRLAEPGAALLEEEIVTVVCSSPLSVSTGFGFSQIDESEFVFVPSTKTVTENGQSTQTLVNRFGFRNKSGFRTLPVILLNTRLWEPNDIFAIHASTGAAVDIKTGQGGTDVEYIVGPSISFWRTLFVTPGLHIGRVNKLAGGFELGQEVPDGIDEPPIEKSWKKAFVTTFTYKIGG